MDAFTIKRIILEMDSPFKVYQLIEMFASLGMTNRRAILDVLNELLDKGLVKMLDVEEDLIVYQSILV